MKRLIFLCFFALSLSAHQITMTKIETLNEHEAYAPMVFHGGYLWLGRVDTSQKKPKHRIEVRTGEGDTLLTSWEVPHSVERLFPYDDQRIVIVGKAFTDEGWVTYYSLAKSCCGAIALETHALPLQFQVEEFAKSGNSLFFTEVGDRALVQISEKGTELLKLNISGPGKLQFFEDMLWILERKSVYSGDENIVRFNPSTHKVERFFSKDRQGLTSILSLSNSPQLATAEYWAQQVLLLDPYTLGKFHTISIKESHPRTLAQWHHCLLVASESPHRLSVIDVRNPIPLLISEYDLETYSEDLPNLVSVVVNPETAGIFLRSAYVGEIGKKSQNSLYRFTQSDWISMCE